MNEVWKTITDFPNYEISNMGEVRRKDTQRLLKPQILGRRNIKYKAVYLAAEKGGKQKWQYIHRLVAKAFIPNPNNYKIVNHKGERMDCRASNLEWCTSSRNNSYRADVQKIYAHRHYEKYKDEIIAKRMAYYEANKEEILRKKKARYEENKRKKEEA